jgi:protein TonB
MIQKKTTKGDLEKRKKTYFSLGLVLVLALVYVCFELFATQDPAPVFVIQDDVFVEMIDDNVAATDQTPPPEAPPQQQQQEVILNVVEDNIAVSTDWDFSSEFNEDFSVIEYVPIDIVQEQVDDAPPVRFAEEMPDFVGGMGEMYKFLQSKLVYPESARMNNIFGVVLVEFVVERDGRVTNVKVVAPLYPDCDKEAIRVIQMMPKWKPGKSMGQPVRCIYQIPVQFSLV